MEEDVIILKAMVSKNGAVQKHVSDLSFERLSLRRLNHLLIQNSLSLYPKTSDERFTRFFATVFTYTLSASLRVGQRLAFGLAR